MQVPNFLTLSRIMLKNYPSYCGLNTAGLLKHVSHGCRKSLFLSENVKQPLDGKSLVIQNLL